MSEGTGAGVLARKIRAAPKGGGREASPWGRTWHVVVARVADEELGVEAQLLRAGQTSLPLADHLAGLPDTGLIVGLEGTGEAVGYAHLDIGFLAGLIEAQTVGRVLSAPPAERMGSRTDAAVVGPLIDRLLAASVEEAAESGKPVPPWSGFTVKGRYPDRRAVELRLDAGPMDVARIEVDFDGAKTGVLSVAVRPETVAAAGKPDGVNRIAYAESVKATTARLAVVLDRPRVPIGWVRRLDVGDRLEIPRSRLSEARVETVGGRLLARARLGQAAGQRAVRLSLGPNAAMHVPAALAVAVRGGTDPGRDMDELSMPGAAGPAVREGLQGGEGALAGMPDLPPLADGGGMPDLPDLPGAGAGSDLPDLPDLPDGGGGMAGLPDLPDLPDLPNAGAGDLPSLGDLPDLPDLPETG